MKSTLISIFVFLVMTMALTACSVGGVNFNVNSETINGSGTTKTEVREVSNFSKVELQSVGNLTIKQGDHESLTIKADDNLMPYITSKVEDGTLKIGMKPNINAVPASTIEYELVVKSLESVRLSGFGNISADALSGNNIEMVLSGSGDINVEKVDAKALTMKLTGFGNINTNEVKSDDASVELTGSGDITIGTFAANTLDLTISGFGNATISGTVPDEKFRLTGSGNFKGGDLESKKANVTISGFGDATVWAENSLDLTITGSGNVNYYGDPHLNQTITGMGKVKSLGSH